MSMLKSKKFWTETLILTQKAVSLFDTCCCYFFCLTFHTQFLRGTAQGTQLERAFIGQWWKIHLPIPPLKFQCFRRKFLRATVIQGEVIVQQRQKH
jgi:hypothetical protein